MCDGHAPRQLLEPPPRIAGIRTPIRRVLPRIRLRAYLRGALTDTLNVDAGVRTQLIKAVPVLPVGSQARSGLQDRPHSVADLAGSFVNAVGGIDYRDHSAVARQSDTLALTQRDKRGNAFLRAATDTGR
ncbi:hypothetical protein E3G55_002446 [Mycobacteroides abscessus]|nr:hypothetical protein [Mycobacteroides abscessus]SIH39894.1 Uncharacterised protein [Mycobacteroides abscessus subsp. abscessus]SII98613.1 Uncharacterised protein [Mycobacteroides abscessus subsp. abscessus]